MTQATKQPAILQPLATRKDVSKFLSVSLITVDKLRTQGKLREIKIGSSIRFDWIELQKLVSSGSEVSNG